MGVVVAPANKNDSQLVEQTLDARVIQPPPHQEFSQNLSLDAGYDLLDMPERVETKGLIPHIRSRRKERDLKTRIPGYRARRWVVERAHSWMNRFRRILIRWEKDAENYLAMLQFACAIITLQACEVFG